MKIIFMGTPEFAVKALERLIVSGYDICCIVSQPDRPANRGHKIHPTPTKEIGLKYNIPVYQPEIIKNGELLPILEKFQPDIIIVAAYGKILPEYVLKYPNFGCINIHGSILPKYRGAAPIQRAVMNGESKTGITIMQMDKGMDTGDILHIEEITIEKNDTSGTMFEKLSILGANILVNILPKIHSGEIVRVKQENSNATYAPMIKKEQGYIDFNKSAIEIHNLIRCFNPKPLAYTTINGIRVKIIDSELMETGDLREEEPGIILETVKNEGVLVSTGNGNILIKHIIPENSKKITADLFLSRLDHIPKISS